MAQARVPRFAGLDLKKLREAIPAIAVIAALVAAWWLVVVKTESAIFPTPLQVVEGTLQLAREGTLWDHIFASLFRVGAGFLLAMAVGIPLFTGWSWWADRHRDPVAVP